MTAEPIGEELSKALETSKISMEMEPKLRARMLADEFKWDITDARKVWSFGLLPDGLSNVLVDVTKGVQYLNEVKDSSSTAFQQVTAEGPFAGEALRGTRFNIHDVVLHADAIHRGAGQIMPPFKRCMYACMIKASPGLMEPIFKVEITVPQLAVSGVYSTLNARRGVIENKEDRVGTPLTIITAYLPVLESFGFASLLRQNTGGQAFPQMLFDHWQPLNGDPYDDASQCASICTEIRQRKGLKAEMPDFNEYYDKIN
jgi:elongation factor 2